jgi:phage baseplate assembly protein W
MDQGLVDQITSLLHDAILDHEPRVDLRAVAVTPAHERGVLMIRIEYAIQGANSRYNMVFPYYLNEAVGMGLP